MAYACNNWDPCSATAYHYTERVCVCHLSLLQCNVVALLLDAMSKINRILKCLSIVRLWWNWQKFKYSYCGIYFIHAVFDSSVLSYVISVKIKEPIKWMTLNFLNFTDVLNTK